VHLSVDVRSACMSWCMQCGAVRCGALLRRVVLTKSSRLMTSNARSAGRFFLCVVCVLRVCQGVRQWARVNVDECMIEVWVRARALVCMRCRVVCGSCHSATKKAGGNEQANQLGRERASE
jgi:hypothetical protein